MMPQDFEKIIQVFRTSVKNQTDIDQLKPYLNGFPGLTRWNFDLDDCDNILRVESENENQTAIIKLLQNFNFDCEELPD